MSDMKCPFCQQELEHAEYNVYSCTSDGCCLKYQCGTKELWQELIRTRKALEIAVDALKQIKDGKTPVSLGIYMDINEALEQITALEQKD